MTVLSGTSDEARAEKKPISECEEVFFVSRAALVIDSNVFLIGASCLYSTNLTVPDIIHISLCSEPCRFWMTLQAPAPSVCTGNVGVACSLL